MMGDNWTKPFDCVFDCISTLSKEGGIISEGMGVIANWS